MHLSYDPEKTCAILIGMSDYENGFPKIPQAVNDVRKFEELLRSKFHFGISQIERIENKAYSKAIVLIQEAIDKFIEDKNETLLFYFSGHAESLNENGRSLLFFLGIDAIYGNVTSELSISFEKRRNYILTKGFKTAIFILDCCKSGAADKGNDDGYEFKCDTKYCTITASQSKELAKVYDGHYSNFTSVLFNIIENGLSKTSNDFITLLDVDKYLRKNLKNQRHKTTDQIGISEYKFCHNIKFNLGEVKKLLTSQESNDFKTAISLFKNYISITDEKVILNDIETIKEISANIFLRAFESQQD